MAGGKGEWERKTKVEWSRGWKCKLEVENSRIVEIEEGNGMEQEMGSELKCNGTEERKSKLKVSYSTTIERGQIFEVERNGG